MAIQKKYTKDGLMLTHPSGVITITTLEALRRHKDDLLEAIDQNNEAVQRIGQDLIALINAGAK